MKNIYVAILRTDGTNCDEELFYAFKLAGGKPKMVHINALLSKKDSLSNYHVLGIPGGFSYGDDIFSGKILANELSYQLNDQIQTFIKRKKLIIGICNGFQVLVRMGLLPGSGKPAEEASLIVNDSARFECRWIKLRIERSNCVWTKGLEGYVIDLPVAHGEGKFITMNQKTLSKIVNNKQVVVRYSHGNGMIATQYPINPNGSQNSIAGISDKTGRIFGLMPHPERYIQMTQHPNWTRFNSFKKKPSGLRIFENAVRYFQQ